MKQVYCSQCGMKIPIHRKAMPKYSTIIDIIEPHECAKEPYPFDLAPSPIPTKASGEFVDKLESLNPKPNLVEPGDRRAPEHIKKDGPVDPKTSSAPPSLNDMLADVKNNME